jgi:hypothetical protein
MVVVLETNKAACSLLTEISYKENSYAKMQKTLLTENK